MWFSLYFKMAIFFSNDNFSTEISHFIGDGIRFTTLVHGSESHVANGVAQVALNARHRPPVLLRLFNQLILRRYCDVLDSLDLHAARSIGELATAAVNHITRRHIYGD